MIRQAVLLVGGRGTRLWPLTATRPKALLPVAGLPFVEFQLRSLARAGVEEAVLAVGLGDEAAWARYLAGRREPPRTRLAVEEEPLDTAGPVRQILEELDEQFLVLNGDVLYEAELGVVVADPPDADGVLVLSPVEDPSAFGVVVTAASGTVERFVEKPPPGTEPAKTVSAGIYLLRRSALSSWPRGRLSFERVVFPSLVAETRLAAIVAEGAWMDIGTAEQYLAAHEFVISGGSRLHQPPDPSGAGELRGDRNGDWAWLEPGARVDEGAIVEEAVILGGARVRSGAVVRRSVVGWQAEIKSGTIIADHALVGEGCVVGRNCELRSGIRVAPETVLGERAVSFSPPP